MTTWTIKGLCENCGFEYKGVINSKKTYFPSIKCPACNQETRNFDEGYAVDTLNKAEGTKFDYVESQFEIIRQ